ncbi:cytochrome c biogenesis protein CcsA [Planctomicrobium sp. SH661]|uniref:cytochrome c biogenesis protein n=1 Tax=Planctomicrobium sp. SH661 TaxID=3448124 RepID=UPI003F5B3C21
MATVLDTQHRDIPPRMQDETPSQAWQTVQRVLKPLASLKLTVALFLAGIFIVLAGTFAQVDHDIWKVVHDYFRVDFRKVFTPEFPWIHLSELFVWCSPKLFFPPAFAPQGPPNFPDWLGVWCPKGWVIGTVMMLNLFAAHLVRFKVQASGSRLYVGWGVIGLGAVITFLVILSGSNPEGLQAKPIISYDTLWWMMQTMVFALCALSLFLAITAGSQKKEQRWLFGLIAVALGVGSAIAFQTDATNEATMRILYQVVKATFAGLVLLAGCIAVFKKRAGIVLLHAGVGLMMVYDVLVGMEHVESQMHIVEGETVNFTRDFRDAELAIIEPLAGNKENVTVIDAFRISKPGAKIQDKRLPFDIEVVEYFPNSVPLGPQQPLPEGVPEKNPATAGMGLNVRVVGQAGSTGTDTQARFDIPSAYLKLTDHSGKDLGTYLASALIDANFGDAWDEISVDGKTYDLALRFRRLYNDYNVTLKDVQKNDYTGTDKPRDYSSFITLSDPKQDTTFDHRIWMNNPMRYGGKTFYQSGFQVLENGDEMTTLQVVDNAGWMTPYVACMMVVVGMIYHFGQTLLRYLHRRLRETSGAGLLTDASSESTIDHVPHARNWMGIASWIVTAVIVGGVATAFALVAMPRSPKPDEFHLSEFGELPMWYKGRPQPLDTFARNSLMQISDYPSFKLDETDKKSQPAIRWLIALMADEENARDLRVIRIESEEVRNAVGLEIRKGFAYSINELNEKIQKIIEEASKAGKVPAKGRTLFQRKMVELANRVIFYSFLERSMGQAPQIPPDQSKEEAGSEQRMVARAQDYFEYIKAGRETLAGFAKEYGLGPLPLVVPTHLGADRDRVSNIDALQSKWEPVTIAHIYNQFYEEFPAPTPPAIHDFIELLKDYKAGDVAKFNQDLATYQALLKKHASADDLPVKKVDFEAWYNRVGALNLCSWLYVFAFALALLGWLMLPQIFERSAFWLTVLIFIVHTLALVARIYISGRPPVTNLYSSAVFVGWGVVLGGLIIESMTRLGLGTAVAAVAGFLALRIAHGLAADGDTFVVLEAVLDTQFWLATHVVCIAFGYATTFLAGLFGVLYVLLGVLTPGLSPKMGRELTRMTYGVICFAIFFSFWGTVLGGLWADDSWGRFWGWDPKENGALIIVLWNALVLHARWGGMVRDRGLAILAILGNIVTSWSWFGVNELGVGLHSYGFTEGRLRMLLLFVISQLVIAGIGLLPKQLWWSSRQPEGPIETA